MPVLNTLPAAERPDWLQQLGQLDQQHPVCRNGAIV
jgi:hypothetical protein